jgi:hypothetical protein
LHVVAQASVIVKRESRGGGQRALHVIEAPGSLGELALLDNHPRSASIEALETCEADDGVARPADPRGEDPAASRRLPGRNEPTVVGGGRRHRYRRCDRNSGVV